MVVMEGKKGITINIIGGGNVGTHFAKAFGKRFSVNRVDPHNLAGLSPDAEITIIAVSDGVIGEVASRLPEMRGIVVHTSGATAMDVLKETGRRAGVIWPMQSLSKEEAVDYSEMPLFIEAVNAEDLEILKEVCSAVSGKVYVADSAKRARLHLAAVFANNFANHAVALGQEILTEEGVDTECLMPIIRGTFGKLEKHPARDMQTGPARRADFGTIERHLGMLRGDEDKRRFYLSATESILKMYGHRGHAEK